MINKVPDLQPRPTGELSFLAQDRRIVSTFVDMSGGTWRARTLSGGAVTLDVPNAVAELAT